jgi:hypothetical protein
VPPTMTVLVMTDQGLWSPQLWRYITHNGWHPVRRIRPEATFAPTGQRRQQARDLIPGPGWCWVGAGVAYKHAATRIAATLVVVWDTEQEEPWLLTDLAPDAVDGAWYGLRVWIELGFRALKSFGWQWERTRRTDPARVARHWLVLATATLLSLAIATRLEEAAQQGIPPGRVRRPRPTAPTPLPARARRTSLFARGLAWLRTLLLRGMRWWTAWWLRPDALPDWPKGLTLIRHRTPPHQAYS